MKISELPQEIRTLAIQYFKQDIANKDKELIDNLEDAFSWEDTKEGRKYWANWHYNEFVAEPLEDSIVESVRQQLLDRSNVGIKKYGVTLDRDDLSLLDWLEHAKQESMDQVLYLEKAIQQLKSEQIEFPHRQS